MDQVIPALSTPWTALALASNGINHNRASLIGYAARTVGDGVNAPGVRVVFNDVDLGDLKGQAVHRITMNEVEGSLVTHDEGVASLLENIDSLRGREQCLIMFNAEWALSFLEVEARRLGFPWRGREGLLLLDLFYLDQLFHPYVRKGQGGLRGAITRARIPAGGHVGEVSVNCDAILRATRAMIEANAMYRKKPMVEICRQVENFTARHKQDRERQGFAA